MKELGILGGMGPLATANFYKRIVEKTVANNDQSHIKTLISSNTDIPDRTTVIMDNLDHNLLLDVVREDLKIFEHAGVKRISSPCNTFHYFYDEVQSLTDIKIINMIEETIKEVQKNGGKTIAVLGTRGTIQSGIFEKYANEYGMNILKLDESILELLMNVIYETKASGRTNFPEFLELIENLKNDGADKIIVACTELSIVDDLDKFENIVIDSMDILVRESIIQLGYKMKK